MKLSQTDHDFAIRCIHSGKATDTEIAFLDRMAALFMANGNVTKQDYTELQVLTGGSLSLRTPILAR